MNAISEQITATHWLEFVAFVYSVGIVALFAGDVIGFIKKHWEIAVGVLALAGGIWEKLRYLGRRIASVVIVTRVVDSSLSSMIITYMCRNGKNRRSNSRYQISELPVRALRKYQFVAWQYAGGSNRSYVYRGAPLWVTGVTNDDGNVVRGEFAYARGTVNWEKLIVDAVAHHNAIDGATSTTTAAKNRYQVSIHEGVQGENAGRGAVKDEPENEFKIEWNSSTPHRLLGWTAEDIGPWEGARPGLALSDDLQVVSDEVRRFAAMKDWYSTRGITWKRGMLFEGAPGCGKSSFVRQEARHLDWPVHVMDVGSMTNRDLRAAWTKAAAQAPCFVVIEDVDAVFNGRENVSKMAAMPGTNPLTFDALLQILDGVDQTDGIFVVVTTNHPEHLDPALIRPGRVDRRVVFGPLKLPERVSVARKILTDHAVADRVARESGDVPAAVFQEICCRLAIELEFCCAGNGAGDNGPAVADEEVVRDAGRPALTLVKEVL